MSTAVSLVSSHRVPNHEYITEPSWDLDLTAPKSTRDLAPHDQHPVVATASHTTDSFCVFVLLLVHGFVVCVTKPDYTAAH